MTNPIAVIDFETDPFEYGKSVAPFCAGFFDGTSFYHFWGDDCVEEVVKHILSYDVPMIIYAHNGGKFDFLFMLKHLSEDLFIIGARIVKAYLGVHQLRDSYSIIPIPLKAYKKDDIDYNKMKRDVRETHRKEIVKYLTGDCVYLHELIIAFHEEFGDNLTVGSTAMKQFRKIHKFDNMNERQDAQVRPFYFGGRNQCFKGGIIKGDYSIYDVNSMYPFVMRTYRHPVCAEYTIGTSISRTTMFAKIIARNRGALPIRTKKGLDFTSEYGEYYASIHEIEAGEDTGTLDVLKVICTLDFKHVTTFGTFVDHFYEARLSAKSRGDDTTALFYKFVLNSCYGKSGQNPRDFAEYALTNGKMLDEPWTLTDDYNGFSFWRRPTENNGRGYYNVAIAASVTGAARAELLRGISGATDPVYCDTDSIICRSLGGVALDNKMLGAWKLEGQADTLAIGGKKLYAAFLDGECVKQASKGAHLTPEQIVDVARGGVVRYDHIVPKISILGKSTFISRRIKSTLDLGDDTFG